MAVFCRCLASCPDEGEFSIFNPGHINLAGHALGRVSVDFEVREGCLDSIFHPVSRTAVASSSAVFNVNLFHHILNIMQFQHRLRFYIRKMVVNGIG